MAVEVYLEEELSELVSDVEKNDEWKKKAEELGLKGQVQLAGGEKASPIPFPPMDKIKLNVYHVLCSEYTNVENYSGSTIPLRVLSMIALCRQEGYFETLEVWHNERTADPILVGYPKSRWNGNPFLIARWGDELRSFPELLEIAKKKWRELREAKLKTFLATLDADSSRWANGDDVDERI